MILNTFLDHHRTHKMHFFFVAILNNIIAESIYSSLARKFSIYIISIETNSFSNTSCFIAHSVIHIRHHVWISYIFCSSSILEKVFLYDRWRISFCAFHNFVYFSSSLKCFGITILKSAIYGQVFAVIFFGIELSHTY